MNDLSNCPKCGSLFLKNKFRDICHNCFMEEENAYEKVAQFIRKRNNRSAVMDEVVAATGVEKELIVKFIKEGRIHLANFPNLGYPCENCGTVIQTGSICDNCSAKFKKELEASRSINELKEVARKSREGKSATYKSKRPEE